MTKEEAALRKYCQVVTCVVSLQLPCAIYYVL